MRKLGKDVLGRTPRKQTKKPKMANKRIIQKLQKILKKSKINKNLEKAVKGIIVALKKGDIELAYELSSVKSLVVGTMKASRKDHFRENSDYNEKVLGRSVYNMLDGIHHDLAFKIHKMPSGVTAFTAQGMMTKGKPKKKHPIISMMEKEREQIWQDSKRR